MPSGVRRLAGPTLDAPSPHPDGSCSGDSWGQVSQDAAGPPSWEPVADPTAGAMESAGRLW